jgi:hypothetical protein
MTGAKSKMQELVKRIRSEGLRKSKVELPKGRAQLYALPDSIVKEKTNDVYNIY